MYFCSRSVMTIVNFSLYHIQNVSCFSSLCVKYKKDAVHNIGANGSKWYLSSALRHHIVDDGMGMTYPYLITNPLYSIHDLPTMYTHTTLEQSSKAHIVHTLCTWVTDGLALHHIYIVLQYSTRPSEKPYL